MASLLARPSGSSGATSAAVSRGSDEHRHPGPRAVHRPAQRECAAGRHQEKRDPREHVRAGGGQGDRGRRDDHGQRRHERPPAAREPRQDEQAILRRGARRRAPGRRRAVPCRSRSTPCRRWQANGVQSRFRVVGRRAVVARRRRVATLLRGARLLVRPQGVRVPDVPGVEHLARGRGPSHRGRPARARRDAVVRVPVGRAGAERGAELPVGSPPRDRRARQPARVSRVRARLGGGEHSARP